MSEALIEAHGNDIEVNASEPVIFSNSVGENMTAISVLIAKDEGGSELECQVMLWPVTDANFTTMPYYEYADGYFWLQA